MPQIRRQTCFACALWSVLILAPLAGLTAGFQQYLVSTFTMNDGLPLNQISAVVQTRDGLFVGGHAERSRAFRRRPLHYFRGAIGAEPEKQSDHRAL